MKPTYCLILLLLCCSAIKAQIICIHCYDQNTPLSTGTNNLLVNGSFESVTCGYDNDASFCPSSTDYTGDIASWVCTGGGFSTYAHASNETFAPVADGTTAIYMGNLYANVCSGSIEDLDNFPGDNLDTSCLNSTGCEVVGIPAGYPLSGTEYGGAEGLSISQTVSGLTLGNIYVLEFWAGGESYDELFENDGIFGVDLGFGYTFLHCRPTPPVLLGGGTPGIRYVIEFKATATSHTVKFTNWGHMCSNCSELIVDDVSLYTLAELDAAVPHCISTAYIGGDTALCSNDSLVLYANGDSPYWWSNASAPDDTLATGDRLSLFPPQAGVYILHGNATSDTTHVTVTSPPSVWLGNDTIVCGGATVVLHPTESFSTYVWNDGSGLASVIASVEGYYSVTVTNAAGCEASDSIHLTVLPGPVLSLQDTALCFGHSVLLQAPDGYTYQWQDGRTTSDYSVTTTGLYSVTVTSTNGCTASDAATVANAVPGVYLGPDVNICTSQQTLLETAGAFDGYAWSNGSTAASITVDESGAYSVSVTSDGCLASDTALVTVNAYPLFDLGADTVVCERTTLALTSAVGPYQYVWSTSATTGGITINQPGMYSVTVGNAGCATTDSISVKTIDCDLVFPNAFSPDGNGLNDVFRPVSPGRVESYELRVYNRWGQMVFTSNDPFDGWDGRFNNHACEIGSYAWWCGYVNPEGKREASGSLSLVR